MELQLMGPLVVLVAAAPGTAFLLRPPVAPALAVKDLLADLAAGQPITVLAVVAVQARLA
jgi:hypothetical protein